MHLFIVLQIDRRRLKTESPNSLYTAMLLEVDLPFPREVLEYINEYAQLTPEWVLETILHERNLKFTIVLRDPYVCEPFNTGLTHTSSEWIVGYDNLHDEFFGQLVPLSRIGKIGITADNGHWWYNNLSGWTPSELWHQVIMCPDLFGQRCLYASTSLEDQLYHVVRDWLAVYEVILIGATA
jgi:hypothetical protein